MNRCFLTALLVATFLSSSAFASTIIYLIPNDGSGDNFGFVTYGPGYYFSGQGGTSANDFNFQNAYAPGSTFPGFGEAFLGSGPARVDGMSFDANYLPGPVLFVSQITFPTTPQIFRPLVFVGFSAVAVNPFTLQTYDVSGEAKGFIAFDYFNGAWYVGSGFQEIPEPGTLTLIATGLIGLSVRAWRF